MSSAEPDWGVLIDDRVVSIGWEKGHPERLQQIEVHSYPLDDEQSVIDATLEEAPAGWDEEPRGEVTVVSLD